jgi:hypothetical protein
LFSICAVRISDGIRRHRDYEIAAGVIPTCGALHASEVRFSSVASRLVANDSAYRLLTVHAVTLQNLSQMAQVHVHPFALGLEAIPDLVANRFFRYENARWIDAKASFLEGQAKRLTQASHVFSER